MTLDEAIKNHIVQSERALHDIEYYTTQNDMEWLDDCKKEYEQFAEEERQLAEWLRELKVYRELLKTGTVRGCRNCKNKYYDSEDFPCNDCDNCEHWELMEDEE